MKHPNSFVLTVESPLQGVIKRTSFQSQPPFSSYSSVNIVPWDVRTGRSVSSVRPPLETIPSAAGRANMICRVNGVETNKPIQGLVVGIEGQVYYRNNANGWTAATGSKAASLSTGTPIFAVPFLQNAIIFDGMTSPLVFEYGAATVEELAESAGTAPQEAKFGHVFQGALFVAGEDGNEHILYQSRVGDFTDWDYGVSSDDTGGAWFSGIDNSGLLNGPITAILSANSDRIIVSTLEGLVQMAALPRQGGVFDKLSSQYVLGQGAWCKLPDDTLCMMTPAGMMVLPPAPNAVPALISRSKVPDELIGLKYSYANPVVSMAYDTRWGGVIITVRGIQQQSWLFDPVLGGFQPMEFLGYPYHLLEYPPFITDQTSGVVFSGSGLSRFDKFGSENVESSVTIGPVKISEDSHKQSRIQRMRFVFSRDTPNGEGTVVVSVGNDGQDAINRLLTGDTSRTFEATLSTLKANNGLCYPQLVGHAVAISIMMDSGDLAFEEVAIEVVPFGASKLMRGTQVAVEGEPLDFSTTSNVFDDTLWGGYIQATPDDPCATLVDTTLFVDLSLVDAEFWGHVQESGADIRVTNVDNEPLPFDLIHFSLANKTGFLALKMTQQIPATPVRIWAGRYSAGPLLPTDDFGQYAAYDANWITFYPDGQGNDRTVNLNNLTHTGLPNPITDALVAGPIGVRATNYRTVDTSNNYGTANTVVPATYPVTLIAVASMAANSSIDGLGLYTAGAGNEMRLQPTRTSTAGGSLNAQIDSDGSASETAQSSLITADAGFHHYAGTNTSAIARSAFIDGGGKGSDVDTSTIAGMNQIVVGKGSRAGLSSNSFLGNICLCQVHNATRSDCWIAYQAAMLNQVNFWNGWGAWVQENEETDQPEEPDDIMEVGTWAGYAEAVPLPPAVNQPNWIHYIDLSGLPGDWWTNVLASGQDIRATDNENRFIPLDVISFDKVAMTGFATVRLAQTVNEAHPIRLWVGNADAIVVPAATNYGQYGVYPSDVKGFWPAGGGNDRTSGQRHFTMVGAVAGGVAGPIGNAATSYNGSNQYGTLSSTAIPNAPLTLIAVTKTTTLAAKQAAVSINRTKHLGHSTLVHAPNDTPHMLEVRAYDKTVVATSAVSGVTGQWRSEVGFVVQNTVRGVIVNNAGPDESSTKSIKTHDYNRIVVGARLSGSSTIFWPWNGELSLVSARNSVADISGNWADYHYAMLDQSTFWDTPWVWVAESSGLPQT